MLPLLNSGSQAFQIILHGSPLQDLESGPL